MERKIARVVTKRGIGDPEPRSRLTLKQALGELEELHRMFTSLTGDPDAPMARVVQRRYLP